MNQYIIQGDCTKMLPSLPDGCASLILTDPPYFLDGMDMNWNDRNLRRKLGSNVVGGIPYGMKFDKNQSRNLQRFIEPVSIELLRILKPGGFFLCFSQARLAHRMAAGIEDAGFEIRDMLAWAYEGQGKAFSPKHFVEKMKISDEDKNDIYESIGNRKTPQLKAQMELIVLAQKPREGTFINNWMKYHTGLVDLDYPVVDPERMPGQIIRVPKTRMRYHITEKPVLLLHHLVKIFSREHALVVDPFAGSGSTGIAALQLGRKFIGYENDPHMAKAGEKRVQQWGHRITSSEQSPISDQERISMLQTAHLPL